MEEVMPKKQRKVSACAHSVLSQLEEPLNQDRAERPFYRLQPPARRKTKMKRMMRSQRGLRRWAEMTCVGASEESDPFGQASGAKRGAAKVEAEEDEEDAKPAKVSPSQCPVSDPEFWSFSSLQARKRKLSRRTNQHREQKPLQTKSQHRRSASRGLPRLKQWMAITSKA